MMGTRIPIAELIPGFYGKQGRTKRGRQRGLVAIDMNLPSTSARVTSHLPFEREQGYMNRCYVAARVAQLESNDAFVSCVGSYSGTCAQEGEEYTKKCWVCCWLKKTAILSGSATTELLVLNQRLCHQRVYDELRGYLFVLKSAILGSCNNKALDLIIKPALRNMSAEAQLLCWF